MMISVALLPFLCLVLLETFTNGLDKSCPPGWDKKPGDNCYYIGVESISYDEASQRCESMTSELFPVVSRQNQNQLIALLGKKNYNCRKDSCHEFWIGVRGGLLDQPNQIWAPGYPTDEGDCVLLSLQKVEGEIFGQWKNADCKRPSRFICFAKAHPKKETPPQDPGTQSQCSDVIPLINRLIKAFEDTKEQIIQEVKNQMEKDAGKFEMLEAQLYDIQDKVNVQLPGQLDDIENLILNIESITSDKPEKPASKPEDGGIVTSIPSIVSDIPGKPKNKTEDEGCPDGFDYVPEINQCLYLNEEWQKWSNARDACASIAAGAQLVMITDWVKQKAVRKFLEQKFSRQETDVCTNAKHTDWGKIVWLGGQTSDPDQCDTPYVWKPLELDATPFNYTNWHIKAPDCQYKGENCVIMMTAPKFDYQWEDFVCKVAFCSVCEF